MNREQIRDTLAEIAGQQRESIDAGQRAYDMARRLEKELAADWEEPEVPEPEEPIIGVRVERSTKRMTISLPDAPRASQTPVEWEGDYIVGAFHLDNPFIEHFRTEAGGVTETICVLHNGNPQGKGAIRIPKLEIKTHDGRDIFHYDGEVVIEPGQMLVVSDYHKGDFRDPELVYVFAAALADDGQSPGPKFIGKLEDELDRQFYRLHDVGPYIMGWPADKSGASQGGDGIEPYWHLWRNCAAGRALALLEVQRTAQREFRVMTNEAGMFAFDPTIAYNADGDEMPDAFKRDRRNELGEWYSHDAQHLARATRAAMWIDELTNGTHAFTRWYLEMLANFHAACNLSTAADREDVNSSNWWSLARTVEWAKEQGPNPKCGRGAVHRARFAFYCKKAGIGGRAMVKSAELFVDLFAESTNGWGRSFEMEARKIPVVKAESEKPNGEIKWADDDKCAQTRELQLAVAMMRDSGYPELEVLGGQLAENLGPFPRTQQNYTRGESWGGFNPYYELMTHGDTTAEEFGGPETPAEERRQNLLKVAVSRGVEAGGVQPLNSCRDVAIWRGSR